MSSSAPAAAATLDDPPPSAADAEPAASRRTADPLLTVVVPALDEAARLPALHRALRAALDRLRCRWEIVLVDDGSADGTAEAWRALMADDPRLGLVVLARNFGKEPALLAGFAAARGDVVVPMDADLQDPPEVLGEFLARWRDGYDTVYGVRRSRRDPWWKRLTSAAYYRVLRRLSRLDIPADAGDFRLLDRAVVDRLAALPEVDRYTRGLYHWVGGRAIGVPYDRPARVGESRYRLGASLDQAIAGLSFTDAPLQAVFTLGFAVSALALLWLLACVVRHALGVEMAWGWASLMCAVTFLGGVQLIAVGVLGLYLGRVFREVKRRPAYLVAAASGAVRRAA